MPKIYNSLDTRSEVTALKIITDNLIAFSTKFHGVKLFAPLSSEIKLNLVSEHINSQTKALAFSSDGQLLALSNETHIIIIDMQSKEIVKKIPTDGTAIDILAFDLSSNYIIAGTKYGRVLQYKYNDASLLSRLFSFPYDQNEDREKIINNYVSALTFYKNKLACSGYGGAILILDLYSQSSRTVFTHDKSRSDALCFVDDNTIINGNSNGIIHIRSLKDKRIHKQINTPFTKIKHIILMPNPEFIMVCGQTNSVAIIDIKNYKLLHAKYIEFADSIHTIALLDDQTLMVALNNSQILTVKLPSQEMLKSFILHNSFDLAYNLIAKEPMLRNSQQHLELENKFQKIYHDAIDALIHHNKKLAEQLTNIFQNVPSKKILLDQMFIAFDNYPKLQILFLNKKYTLAYAIISKYPPLQHTWQYKRMEQIWKYAFMEAQRQILLGREGNARLYLNDYMTVQSKRPLIKLILKQNKEFIEFLKAAEEKNFLKVFQLAQQNEIFTQIPSYVALKEEMYTYLKEASVYIQKGDIPVAKQYLAKLQNIPIIQEHVLMLYEECAYVLKLQKAYKEDNFIACYTLLDKYKILEHTDLGLALEKHWLKLMSECEIFAQKGNTKEIKLTLGELLTLPARLHKIGDLLRLSFQVKIKILTSKKSFKKAESTIYSYIDIFGLDNEIEAIMRKFEKIVSYKLAFTQDQNLRLARNYWVHSPFILNLES